MSETGSRNPQTAATQHRLLTRLQESQNRNLQVLEQLLPDSCHTSELCLQTPEPHNSPGQSTRTVDMIMCFLSHSYYGLNHHLHDFTLSVSICKYL